MMVADKHKDSAKRIYEQYIKPDVSITGQWDIEMYSGTSLSEHLKYRHLHIHLLFISRCSTAFMCVYWL